LETDVKRIYDAGFDDGFRKAENAQHGPGNFSQCRWNLSWNEIGTVVPAAQRTSEGKRKQVH